MTLKQSSCPDNVSLIDNIEAIETPAYVYDLSAIRLYADLIQKLVRPTGVRLLYAMKACSEPIVLHAISDSVEGFSCSSANEVDVALACALKSSGLHWVSPLITELDTGHAFRRCQWVTLNSLNQFRRWKDAVAMHGNVGLRVNPALSVVDDIRYDPCEDRSRLGVFPEVAQYELRNDSTLKQTINGLHLHTNCDSVDGEELLKTIKKVVQDFGHHFEHLRWVNIGGGYLPTKWSSAEFLDTAVRLLRDQWSCDVIFEPGADFVRDAGYMVSTVQDIVKTPGGAVAILDSSVNHWPEVFEFQFEPDAVGNSEQYRNKYTLAGRSCLAGDIFGEYCFESRLQVGDRVVFTEAGAYSLVKAHQFNGLPLPNIYYTEGSAWLDKFGSHQNIIAAS